MENILTRLPEHADNMSIALVSSSFSPLILLQEDLTIIAASKSFCDAFPGRTQKGTIKVGYKSNGDAWTLVVADDGIGMAKDEEDRKPGLGTGIVEALAGQLDAVVVITDQAPGTQVSIVKS